MKGEKGMLNKSRLRIKIQIAIIVAIFLFVSFVYFNTASADNTPFILKWNYATGLSTSGGIGPLAVDVTGDGIMEIFVSGDNASGDKIFCFYGNNGTLKWSSTTPYSIVPHNPMEIYDLNNDGIPELVQPSPNGMMVYHANNGILYWKNQSIKSTEAHQLVLDTDKNGYPYIYSCSASTTPGVAKLRKINGRTGVALITKDIWYPCHGGLSAADVDNDGDFELYLSDRSSGSGGKGIRCYDASTLNLIWNKGVIYCASHLPVIVDVNKDGILDVVVSQQRDLNAGIYCLDGRDGSYITGKYQDRISGLAVHETFPVYDIDNDGNLELATCAYSDVKVFDLGTWSIEATLEYDGKPPYYANVMGDDDLEIILSEEVGKIRFYDNQYQLIYILSGIPTYTSTVQDIDNDGLNELISISGDGLLRVYDTLATASYPLPRTNTNHYSERNTRTGIYIPPPGGIVSGNHLPVVTTPNPENGADDIPITTSSLSIMITDPDGDLYNYTITTSPNIGSKSGNYKHNGIKICNISGLQYSTKYTWYVHATDGISWTNCTYWFTTQNEDSISPQISNIVLTVSDPMDTQTGFGWENISCTITDNIDVDSVSLIITYPNDIKFNISMMNQPRSNLYYYNTSYSNIGNYTYFILAKDTNGNSKSSITHEFSMIPNWDINKDGRCTVLDIISISSYYGKVGSPGWIREDIDNNGQIEVLDFNFLSIHYWQVW